MNLGSHVTAFQAELIAISTCAQILVYRRCQPKIICIMIDSQAPIKVVRSVKTQSVIVKECGNALVTLAEYNRVTL